MRKYRCKDVEMTEVSDTEKFTSQVYFAELKTKQFATILFRI